MKKWTVFLIEDDPIVLRRLKKLVEQDPDTEIIGEANSAKEFQTSIKKRVPDFIICDIDLPDSDGIQIAQWTIDNGLNIPFIFITGLSQFATDSYLVNTVDYMLKPIQQDRFEYGLNKMKTKLTESQNIKNASFRSSPLPSKLVVKKEDGLAFLDTESIVLICKDGKKTSILSLNFNGKEYVKSILLTNESMKDLYQKIKDGTFIRSHNSFIINLKWIKEVIHYSTDSYKIKFYHVNDYALLNRDKLTDLIKLMD